MTLTDLYKQSLLLSDTPLMPVLFVGHGSPMNVIEKNEFTNKWAEMGRSLPYPQAILCISAHWETRGTRVTAVERPKTIHDFYGFPEELYKQEYLADGYPALAENIKNNISDINIGLDYEWGLDHGAWSLLKFFYPKVDIPVIQMSIDYTKGADYHFKLAKELIYLRRKGVLVIGSGNMIHNLRILEVGEGGFNAEYGYEWALELNDLMKRKINAKDYESLIHYQSFGKGAQLAIPTPEHYIPLLYALGMQTAEEQVKFFNDKVIAGALSMTSLSIGCF